MKTKTLRYSSHRLIAGLFLAVFAFCPAARAATFSVPNGNIAALVSAINTANGNGQYNIINLAANGTYTLTTVNNSTDGSNGLPVIEPWHGRNGDLAPE